MYAEAIVDQLRELGDTNTIVWIHDFHLFLVPKLAVSRVSYCHSGLYLEVHKSKLIETPLTLVKILHGPGLEGRPVSNVELSMNRIAPKMYGCNTF